MASSSLSQEDVDHDFELSSRRSRIRSARASARNAPPCRLLESHDADGQLDQLSGLGGGGGVFCGLATGDLASAGGTSSAAAGGEHDVSPKPASRAKDKRCPRSNHVNKGKAQRERRKLREKRRSTGVVHLPSTESTGGSTGEDEDELLSMSVETRRNTAFNEATAEKDNAAANGDELPKGYPMRNNKSPSDLDADDEDNQDYDSTVNQSDSAVSLLHEAGTIEISGRITANGRPETPCSENIEELLDRVREENRRLLGLLKDRDEKLTALEQRLHELSQDLSLVEAEKQNLQVENQALLSAMASLRAA